MYFTIPAGRCTFSTVQRRLIRVFTHRRALSHCCNAFSVRDIRPWVNCPLTIETGIREDIGVHTYVGTREGLQGVTLIVFVGASRQDRGDFKVAQVDFNYGDISQGVVGVRASFTSFLFRRFWFARDIDSSRSGWGVALLGFEAGPPCRWDKASTL